MACLALFVVACSGGGGDSTIDRTYDPCALTIAVDETGRQGVDDALALWGFAESEGPALPVTFEPAATSFRGLYDDERGIVIINAAITDPATRAIVIAHEMGHAFGLAHRSDRASVMKPGNLSIAPTDDDRAEVNALWGPCDARPRS